MLLKSNVVVGILCLSTTTFSQEQITNSGFEDWYDVTSGQTLDYWSLSNYITFPLLNATAIPDGFSGQALRLENLPDPEDEASGVGAFAGLTASVFPDVPQGQPYADNIDRFHAYLRYDLAVGDTAGIRIALKKDGAFISFLDIPITGTVPDWTLFSWDLTVFTDVVSDTAIILIYSSFPEETESATTIGSWLEVDHLAFSDGADMGVDPIPNFSFEDWTDVILEKADHWTSFDNYTGVIFGEVNTTKSTDAVEGDYSVQINTYNFNGDYELRPYYTNGIIDFENEEVLGGDDFTGEPLAFKFMYKFTAEETDNATVYVKFWNDLSDDEYYEELTTNEAWTSYSIPTDLGFTPDSVLIVFQAGENDGTQLNLDAIRFVYDDASLSEKNQTDLQYYPNPTDQILTVTTNEFAMLTIMDSSGKILFSSDAAAKSHLVNTTDFVNGTYIMHISNDEAITIKKFVVQH